MTRVFHGKTIYGVNVMGAIRKLFSYWFSLKWEENGFLSPRRSLNTLLYAGRCNLKVVTWKMNCQFILHPFAIIPVQHHKKCPSHSGLKKRKKSHFLVSKNMGSRREAPRRKSKMSHLSFQFWHFSPIFVLKK